MGKNSLYNEEKIMVNQTIISTKKINFLFTMTHDQ